MNESQTPSLCAGVSTPRFRRLLPTTVPVADTKPLRRRFYLPASGLGDRDGVVADTKPLRRRHY